MNKSFLDALLSNQGWGALDPISRAPAYEDDAGNQYAANGNIIRKGVADGSMTWGETALAGATAPAKLATGLASTLSPYGSEGFQVPPILAEPVRAGNRLLNSGGFPDPQDPQNQQDAVTSLLSFFGANAFGGARAGAGAAAALSDTSRPSVMGSAIGSALDMSPEARLARAREQGFDTDTTWYHGTHTDFSEFKKGVDTNFGGAQAAFGHFLTDNPKYADLFTRPAYNGQPGGPQIMPLRTRGNFKDLDISVLDDLEKLGSHDDWNLAQTATPKAQALVEQLKAEGYDGVRFSGVTGRSFGAADELAIFDPSNIRSVNAAFDPARAGENGLLLSDNARPSLLGSAVAAEQAPTKGITAYHGSPHDFDKFDMSKIGTGEGAQAYGHGLYFAESEGVAKSYRDGLSGGSVKAKDGIATGYPDIDFELEKRFDGNWDAFKRYHGGPNASPSLLQAIADIDARGGINYDSSGHMYQVRINADPNDFLDWDKPLSQQPRNVRQLMRYIGSDTGERLDDLYAGDWLSSYARSAMADETGETLESMLKRRGVPGIKYLDQMSRNAGDGSRNYVVFNQEIIDILKKYGAIPGLYGASQVGQERQ